MEVILSVGLSRLRVLIDVALRELGERVVGLLFFDLSHAAQRLASFRVRLASFQFLASRSPAGDEVER
jgi:hypothetical protein